MAFGFAGFCAAIAGPLYSSQTNRIIPTQGDGLELSAIAMAVLGGIILEGGKGSIIGTLFGVLTYQFLINLLKLSGLGTYMGTVIKGLLLIVIVTFYEVMRRRS